MAHGNGAAPGVHRLAGRFYELAAAHFEAARLEPDPEHPGCQIHCLVRRPSPMHMSAASDRKAKRKRVAQ